MASAVVFKAKGFLEKSYLGKDGDKHITLEFSSGCALEIAKLELLSRDLDNHLPVLLDIKVTQDTKIISDEETKKKKRIKRRNFKG